MNDFYKTPIQKELFVNAELYFTLNNQFEKSDLSQVAGFVD